MCQLAARVRQRHLVLQDERRLRRDADEDDVLVAPGAGGDAHQALAVVRARVLEAQDHGHVLHRRDLEGLELVGVVRLDDDLERLAVARRAAALEEGVGEPGLRGHVNLHHHAERRTLDREHLLRGAVAQHPQAQRRGLQLARKAYLERLDKRLRKVLLGLPGVAVLVIALPSRQDRYAALAPADLERPIDIER
eukprot:6017537-Prymnesium_polylepis.1